MGQALPVRQAARAALASSSWLLEELGAASLLRLEDSETDSNSDADPGEKHCEML